MSKDQAIKTARSNWNAGNRKALKTRVHERCSSWVKVFTQVGSVTHFVGTYDLLNEEWV